MKRNGFTLIELLLSLAMLGIVLIIGICASRNMLTTSLVSLRAVSDNEVFKAAKAYVSEYNIPFNDKAYACVGVRNLMDYGYLLDTNDETLKNKMVKLKKNRITKVISSMEYTDNCD